MTDETIGIVRGSGNVFRDFGHPDADREQLRAILAAGIIGVLDDRGLSIRDRSTPPSRNRRARPLSDKGAFGKIFTRGLALSITAESSGHLLDRRRTLFSPQG
jgi:hypothetical protein